MDKVNIVMTYTDSITYENNVELILHVGHEGYDLLQRVCLTAAPHTPHLLQRSRLHQAQLSVNSPAWVSKENVLYLYNIIELGREF